MTKVTDKIKNLIDPKHKGFRKTITFKVLIGLAALILLGIIYNVFIRRSQTQDMTDDEKEEEAARKAALDTMDVVGDYLWPDSKPAKKEKQEDEKEEEGKPVEHAKESPVAAAATEEDIENAKKLIIASIIPDSLSTLIERKRPKSVGNMLYIFFVPSLAPSKKLSKTLFFSISP